MRLALGIYCATYCSGIWNDVCFIVLSLEQHLHLWHELLLHIRNARVFMALLALQF